MTSRLRLCAILFNFATAYLSFKLMLIDSSAQLENHHRYIRKNNNWTNSFVSRKIDSGDWKDWTSHPKSIFRNDFQLQNGMKKFRSKLTEMFSTTTSVRPRRRNVNRKKSLFEKEVIFANISLDQIKDSLGKKFGYKYKLRYDADTDDSDKIPVIIKRISRRRKKVDDTTTSISPNLPSFSETPSDANVKVDRIYVNQSSTESTVVFNKNVSVLDGSVDNGPDRKSLFTKVLRVEFWSYPVMVTSIVTISLIGIFELYLISVTITSSKPHSKRSLFLGQILLLGTLWALITVLIGTLPPNNSNSCAYFKFSMGLTYAIIYGSFLVKLVFFISLHSGIYLPAIYQTLLLSFALSIQVVVSLNSSWYDQSHLNSTRSHDASTALIEEDAAVCLRRQTLGPTLLSMVYICILFSISLVLSVKAFKIPHHYRESRSIALALVSSLVIHTFWALMAVTRTLSEKIFNYDFYLAMILLCTAISTFVIMFLPQGRRLSTLGYEGLFPEDKPDHKCSFPHNNVNEGFDDDEVEYNTTQKVHGMEFLSPETTGEKRKTSDHLREVIRSTVDGDIRRSRLARNTTLAPRKSSRNEVFGSTGASERDKRNERSARTSSSSIESVSSSIEYTSGKRKEDATRLDASKFHQIHRANDLDRTRRRSESRVRGGNKWQNRRNLSSSTTHLSAGDKNDTANQFSPSIGKLKRESRLRSKSEWELFPKQSNLFIDSDFNYATCADIQSSGTETNDMNHEDTLISQLLRERRWRSFNDNHNHKNNKSTSETEFREVDSGGHQGMRNPPPTFHKANQLRSERDDLVELRNKLRRNRFSHDR